jgi:Uma2 family endonuclease
MLEVLEDPIIRARVPRLSVELYHRMIELGAVAPNVELIRGALVEQMPQSPLHASVVEMLREYVAAHVPQRYFVRQEKPLTLSDSEPEPDLAVVPGDRAQYRHAHPTSAELVIEVCITTEHLDRVKLGIYAQAGVRECWLLLAEERAIERHTEPHGNVYQRIERATFPATLESTMFPGVTLPPTQLFPS